MFSIFKRSEMPANDLLVSRLYCDKTFYRAFESDLKHAKNEVVIESPFIACKRTDDLLPVLKKLCKRGIKVRINTRNPNHHDKELRIQAWTSIKRLRAVGVKVVTYDDMRHRKLAIIDEEILWEGSLNIMSQSYSREIMRRTRSNELCLQMASFTGIRKKFWYVQKHTRINRKA